MHLTFNPTKTSIKHKQYFIFKTVLKQLFVASKLGSYFFFHYTISFLKNFKIYIFCMQNFVQRLTKKLCLMFRYYLRSDAQRSEEHKLKKEKELEKEIAASEREDDGGFSMQVKIIFLSSPGPKPLAPNPLVPNPKLRGLGLTLNCSRPPPPPLTFKHD